MKILITAGGTREYIDGVRYIGNCSSGNTGAALVNHLVAAGHDVTWLGARSATKPTASCQQIQYETFADLAEQLQHTLGEQPYDLVFQAAAVSDFKVSSVILDGQEFAAGRDVKLPTADQVQLNLSKQPKLVSALKNWSLNPDLKVLAFKLTNCHEVAKRQAAIDKLLTQDVIDGVAHNDLNEITDDQHGFHLYFKQGEPITCPDIRFMADQVLQQLERSA